MGGNMRKIKSLIVLLAMVFSLSGCVAAWLAVGAGAGIGTYKFIEGELTREYPLQYARAWDATNSALANHQISITNSMDEGVKGKIEAVRRDGTKVVLKLTDRGQGVTSISIRVGMLGDRSESEIIHDEIASVSGIR
jgi:hypothetical protein